MFVLRGTSERVAAAVRAADTGDTGPAEELWAAAVRAGGPLLEPDGDGQVAATFLWRGAADRVDLVGIYNNKDLRATTLTRIDGTDVWHLTLRLPGTLRTGYGFSVGETRGALATDDEWREATQRRWHTDPLNGETFRMTYNTDGVAPDPAPYTLSVFDPAGRGPSRWLRPDPAVPAGEVTMHRLPAADTGLGCDHRVWLYRPAGEVPAGGWPLALLFDGEYYVELIPTPTVLDNLAAAGRIPPTAAVLLDSVAGTRTAELNGNRAFLAFLVDELLPWAGKLLPCTADPARTVVAGASLGGACASYAALTAPDRFGLVLAQSGAYQWGGTDDFPDGLIVGYGSAPRLPIRWYLDVGLAEDAVLPGQATSLLEANRRMRDALAGRGYRLRYVEHPGGHDHLRWRDTLADGLIELLGAA